MLRVLDVAAHDLEAVNFRRQRRGDRRLRDVAGPRDHARRARRVRLCDRLQPEALDHLAALAQRLDVTVDRAQVGLARAAQRQKLVRNALEVFADDLQAGVRQEMMDVRHAPRDRVLDGDHCAARITPMHGIQRVFKGCAAHGFHVGKLVAAGDMRVGPRFALVGDLHRGAARGRFRQSGVGRRVMALLHVGFHLLRSSALGALGRLGGVMLRRGEQRSCARQVVRRVNAQRHAVNEAHTNAHAGFERA